MTTSEMANERSVVETSIIRSRFLDIPRNHTGSVKDGNEIAQGEESLCFLDLLKCNSQSTWPYFLRIFVESPRAQGASV